MSEDSSSTPERTPPVADPQSVEGVFLQALARASVEEREAFLDEACGQDRERRRRVEALLRAYDDAGSFLEKPPAGVPAGATVSLDFLTPSRDPGLLGTLGEYEVYEMLGRGGMGIVFRARDPKLNRVVAIKVLAPELAANPNARRRFLREAQAAAAISHPHVVTIHAVDEGSVASGAPAGQHSRGVSSLPFLVMECIVGQTLQQKLDKQGALRVREILRIGQQTAEGLAAAHKQGLIHRDIKPANVLLENGVERVKITDFGLARAVDDVSITRTGEVSGTPQYMSPEQASGGVVDHRSDLFSLGSVLYAMCTGRSPFRATTLAAAIRRVCDDTPRPIEEINPEVPGWLIEIVNRLLEKDPDDRIQSAAEVASLLGEHLAVVQQPPGRRPLPERRASAPPVQRTVSAGSSVPPRALIWLGSLLLLTPVVIALFGTAMGAGGDALEGAVVAGIFCLPTAVAAFAVGLMDRSVEGNPTANALFILCCVLLGPIGILLYLVRRDQWSTPGASSAVAHVREPSGPNPAEAEGDRAAPEVPRWLLTPLPGPMRIIAAGMFAVAGLMIGQGLEQWADHSTEAGVGLQAAGWLLGILAIQLLRACGVTFTPATVVAAGLLAVLLMFFGAQAPNREFNQGVASLVPLVAVLSTAVGLMSLAGMALLAMARAGRGDGDMTSDSDPQRQRDRVGLLLIVLGLLLPAFVVVFGVLVGLEIISAPPMHAGEQIARTMMTCVFLGGFLFAAGMILQRRVLLPGMVRQWSRAAEGREPDGRAAGLGGSSPTSPRSPWQVLGWMIVGGLVLIPGCLAVMFSVAQFARQATNEGIVTLKFDSLRPVTKVVVRGDIGAAHAQQHTTEHLVTQSPFSIALLEGVYDLTLTYQADGRIGQFTQRVRVEPGASTTLDVRQQIALSHQLQYHDRQPPVEKDGYPPPRVIPLADSTTNPYEDVDWKQKHPRGGISITLQDQGLSVFFQAVDDPMLGGGDGKQLIYTKDTTDRLLAGRYRVMVSDELAGWHTRYKHGERGGVQYEYDVVDIVPHEIVTLTISRNFKRMLASHPLRGEGLYGFRWNCETYDLSINQALMMMALLHAYADGEPEIHEARLLKGVAVRGSEVVIPQMSTAEADEELTAYHSRGETLASFFNNGEHPAWGTAVIEGEVPQHYRLATLIVPAGNGELKSPPATPQPSDDPRPSAFAPLTPGQGERAGQLTIDVRDDGFLVAVRRKSAFGGGDLGSEQQVTEYGMTTLSLHPGEYEVLIRDQLFGWGDRTESVTVGTSGYREVVVERNLAGYAKTEWGGGNVLTRIFHWDGRKYALASRYGLMLINRLLQAHVVGTPEVSGGTLLNELLAARDDNLENQSGRNEDFDALPYHDEPLGELTPLFFTDTPIWGELIVPGDTEGTYRLAPLDRGTLQIDSLDLGMSVFVQAAGPNPKFSHRTVSENAKLELPPGEYQCSVGDGLVGWGAWTPPGSFNGRGPTRVEMVTIATGEEKTVKGDRRWADYLHPPQPDERSNTIMFTWFPPDDAGSSMRFSDRFGFGFFGGGGFGGGGFGGGGFGGGMADGRVDLDQRQFAVTLELLKAFAAGTPEVAESELLERANITDRSTLTEVFFEASDEESVRWKTIIVPGETEGTWRLKPPPEVSVDVE